jgi:hypothetical protein
MHSIHIIIMQKKKNCHVIVTIQGVWMSNWIYWTLNHLTYKWLHSLQVFSIIVWPVIHYFLVASSMALSLETCCWFLGSDNTDLWALRLSAYSFAVNRWKNTIPNISSTVLGICGSHISAQHYLVINSSVTFLWFQVSIF